MRALLQRVSSARVRVGDAVTGEIGRGLLVFLGVGRDDTIDDVTYLVAKICDLRVFESDAGKPMDRSVVDVGGSLLVVSQFTLYADLRKGRRPSWGHAEDPTIAAERVEALAAAIETRGVKVARGVFGAAMEVELVNDGPFTLVLEGSELSRG